MSTTTTAQIPVIPLSVEKLSNKSQRTTARPIAASAGSIRPTPDIRP